MKNDSKTHTTMKNGSCDQTEDVTSSSCNSSNSSCSSIGSSTEESSLAIAIELNNRACYLLSNKVNGKEDEHQFVLELLSTAMDRLKMHATLETVPSDAANANALAGSFQTQTLPPQSSFRYDNASSSNSSSSDLSSLTNIVDRPVLIDELNPATVELYPIYAGCVLFNMAITYHRMAYKVMMVLSNDDVKMSHPNHLHQQEQQLLAKAQGLYQIIYQSLTGAGLLQDDTSLGLCTLALNNIAQLCLHQEKYDQMAYVMRHLQPLVVFQQLEREQQQQQMQGSNSFYFHVRRHLVGTKDLDRITLNLIMWKVPIIAAAA